MEGYELQPTKSVVLNTSQKQNNRENSTTFTMGTQKMPAVECATHLGIIRTTSLKGNTIANVEENMKKARRSAYSLFGGGFHGHNGLDVDTMVHLFKKYISPVLLYGLELILPTANHLTLLENFQKKLLKQILSLYIPTSVADITIYILTGIYPIEAQLHIRALGLFNNICHQSEINSMEKLLARRQLSIKNDESASWFIAIKHILRKYELKEAIWYLDKPVKKSIWTTTIKKTILNYWSKSITALLPLYKGLNFLSYEHLEKGKIHPLFKINCHSSLDTTRLPIKLKLLTGSYILQSKRIKMYKNETDPSFLLCKNGEENIEHFILHCEALSRVRDHIQQELTELLNTLGMETDNFSTSEKM